MSTSKPVLHKQLKDAGLSKRLNGSSKRTLEPLGQDAFLRMLHIERRRTERSGRPFILVLISNGDQQSNATGIWAPEVATVLASYIRETDLLGWYEQNAWLGLLMTEITDASSATIDTLVKKISISLQSRLSSEIYCQLTLVVRVFPENGEDSIFYPDQFLRSFGTQVDHSIKRAIDVIGSLLALLICSPFFVVIGILIKCTSPGPIFFCQTRVGRSGKEFCFYKFRTMVVNNDTHIHREYVSRLIAGSADASQNGGLYKMKNDPRITSVGRFLRRTSLDELPQFFNVLRNDMSLVGPRPPLPYEFERYQTWHKRRVWELKPGITGLWQTEGRSRTTFDEMVRLDIRYARIRNFWQDLRIMVKTPSAMFLGRNAC